MDGRSIHLEGFPEVKNLPHDTRLIEKMEIVRSICNATLSLRGEYKIKVKIPLKQLTIYSKEDLNIKEFESILKEEVNVQDVIFSKDIESVGQKRVMLNLKSCGSKLGKRTKEIMTLVNERKYDLTSDGRLKVNDIILDPEDFKITFYMLKEEDNGNIKYTPVSFNIFSKLDYQIVVSLDIEIDESLERLGNVREIVRCIQRSRKINNLALGDVASLKIMTDSDEIIKIFQDEGCFSYISSNTLSNIVEVKMEELDGSDLENISIENMGNISVKFL